MISKIYLASCFVWNGCIAANAVLPYFRVNLNITLISARLTWCPS